VIFDEISDFEISILNWGYREKNLAVLVLILKEKSVTVGVQKRSISILFGFRFITLFIIYFKKIKKKTVRMCLCWNFKL